MGYDAFEQESLEWVTQYVTIPNVAEITLWNSRIFLLWFKDLYCVIFQIEINYTFSDTISFLSPLMNCLLKICIKFQYLAQKLAYHYSIRLPKVRTCLSNATHAGLSDPSPLG